MPPTFVKQGERCNTKLLVIHAQNGDKKKRFEGKHTNKASLVYMLSLQHYQNVHVCAAEEKKNAVPYNFMSLLRQS